MRVFWRDRGSVFFTFLVPVMIMAIFGVLNLGGTFGHVNLGVVDESGSQASAQFIGGLQQIEALRITKGARDDELAALQKGDRDLVIVFPAAFAPSPQDPATIDVYENVGHAQQVGVGEAILTQAIDRASFAASGLQPMARIEKQQVNSRNLGYVDFLLPGMIAFSVMQLGLFSVAFGIVNQKRTGILRRLLATPLSPAALLSANVIVRVINIVLVVLVLLGMGVLLFKVKLAGAFPEIVATAVLGGAVFLGFGFAIAGYAKNEDQAAPLAQLVSLPMSFLSGVWFPRDSLPDWLKRVTEVLPLTYMADALRDESTQGLHVWDVPQQIVALAVWFAISFVLAVRLFRFE
jgi:ABC-2 type transport system permease protein